ncbi:hypothetical protein [Micromonospora inositola]|uniref:hypothetical protein n=1 Tax=Micromonospora inositola TaxID=47865 RepID=UPI0012FE507E|nr:hypothetical protein [Micromonospora inositola]
MVGMDDISYDDWRAAYWERPDLDRVLTSVALADDVVVAFSLALTDGRYRYQSGMTAPGARTGAGVWAGRSRPPPCAGPGTPATGTP